jgi:hypothetical protein
VGRNVRLVSGNDSDKGSLIPLFDAPSGRTASVIKKSTIQWVLNFIQLPIEMSTEIAKFLQRTFVEL